MQVYGGVGSGRAQIIMVETTKRRIKREKKGKQRTRVANDNEEIDRWEQGSLGSGG